MPLGVQVNCMQQLIGRVERLVLVRRPGERILSGDGRQAAQAPQIACVSRAAQIRCRHPLYEEKQATPTLIIYFI